MKKIKNKFIAIVLLFIVFILWVEIYKTFLTSWPDRNSYVVLVEGEANLNNLDLILNNKSVLKPEDIIKTIWTKSLALVKWWDWSITRVWWNSVLKIYETNIEQNLLNIKISFELKKWKTWSDVISFIWSDSYFHQTFADTTAAVRWTTFEVNLDKDYVYVDKHEVTLTDKSGKQKIVTENKPFIISKFYFTDFTEFVKKFKDTSWQEINKNLDKQYYKKLLNSIWEIDYFTDFNIEEIPSFSEEKKSELYSATLEKYQKLHFVATSDIENYRKKLELKKILLDFSSDEDKERILHTFLYDFKDLANNKQIKELTEVIWVLGKNIDTLKNLDTNISNYIDFKLFDNKIFDNITIPEWLKSEFENSINDLSDLINIESLDIDIVDWLNDSIESTIGDITNSITDIKNIGLEKLNK